MLPVLLIHGGAGAPSRSHLTPSLEAEMREFLKMVLTTCGALLETGGSAIDAVTEAVRLMEDCPHLNAGRGSVFNEEGEHELDAAIQCGRSGKAGSVCAVRKIKNPILTARALLEDNAHVMLAGAGAEAFSRERGFQPVENSYFSTQHRRTQLESARASQSVLLDGGSGGKFGTVGAVALDSNGCVAAATSTGGMTNKRSGRVGDSPCLGCGTFADERVAVSCTGSGEAFLKACAAKDVASNIQYSNRRTIEEACDMALARVGSLGGSGGIIAVRSDGESALRFDTEGMYRGVWKSGKAPGVAIWKEELH